jgi:hypothetical protein
MPLENYKIPIFENINDIPRPPSDSLGCNGSYLISQVNNLITELQVTINNLQTEVNKIAGLDASISTMQPNVNTLTSEQASIVLTIAEMQEQLTILNNTLITLDKLQFKTEIPPYTLQMSDYLHRIDISASGVIILPIPSNLNVGWQCEIRLTADNSELDFQSIDPSLVVIEPTGGDRYHFLRRKNGVAHIIYAGNNTYQLTGVLES